MKKTIITSIISILLAVCMVAVTIAVAGCSDTTKTDAKPTVAATTSKKVKPQTETTTPQQTQTANETTAPQQTQTTNETADTQQTQTANESADTQQSSEQELALPDVTGLWMHSENNGCSIQVLSQDKNTIDIKVESHNENYSKIDSVELFIPLTLCKEEGVSGVFGTSTVGYMDSFGNKGYATIVVFEDKIALEIEQYYDANCGWDLTAASGEYYLK